MEKLENNIEIKNIYIQIEKLKLSINKKEDDLKNIINEKEMKIQNLQEIIMNLNKKIENNEKEISKLNDEIESNKKEISKLNDKIGNNEKKIAKLNNIFEGSEKEIKKLNIKNEELVKKTENIIKEDNIKRANKELKLAKQKEIISEGIYNISRRFSGTSKSRIEKELEQLVDLERNYGFLSSIGGKLLRKNNGDSHLEIEGLIKAPENSPYKNGIFNFLLKYVDDYPYHGPKLFFKTKILHCECNDNGHCCTKFLNDWREKYNISQIIGAIYHFFICSKPDHGYGNEATHILRENNYSYFEKKCQEYVRSYANLFFDDNSDYYLFQEINDEITKELFSKEINCVFVENGKSYNLILHSSYNIRELMDFITRKTGERLNDKAFIVGNKVYSFDNSDNKIFLNYKTMFIISKALPY